MLKGRQRLIKELNRLTNDSKYCFGVDYWDPDADNPDIFHWRILLPGLRGTPYEGGFYEIEARFNEDYPNTAPIMKFLTRIFHCNIAEGTGDICVNILKSDWEPTFDIGEVLYHIYALLSLQNPNSPLNSHAADLYLKDPNEFLKIAKEYTKKYANINDYDDLEKQNIPLFNKL